jgi:hypothetical protein
MEGQHVVETDAATARAGYLDALEALRERWSNLVEQRGGRFLRASTADEPVSVVRRIVEAVR